MVEITINKFHLGLLDRLNIYFQVSESDFGAPAVDEKRPYGSTDLMADLMEVFLETVAPGAEVAVKEGSEELILIKDDIVMSRGEALEANLIKHHREMDWVLQILAKHRGIELGTYRRDDSYDSMSWRKVEVDG